jgi:hypothetical protein
VHALEPGAGFEGTRRLAHQQPTSRTSGRDSPVAALLAQEAAAVARAKQRIGEAELQILQMRTERLNEVTAELRQTQDALFNLAEPLHAARDVLDRHAVRAPRAGSPPCGLPGAGRQLASQPQPQRETGPGPGPLRQAPTIARL